MLRFLFGIPLMFAYGAAFFWLGQSSVTAALTFWAAWASGVLMTTPILVVVHIILLNPYKQTLNKYTPIIDAARDLTQKFTFTNAPCIEEVQTLGKRMITWGLV